MKNIERMKKCPRFDTCSCPNCPLDQFYKSSFALPGEEKCKLSKKLRQKIGSDLPWKGLTPKELAGVLGWMKKSENSKLKIRNILHSKGSNTQFAPRIKKLKGTNNE